MTNERVTKIADAAHQRSIDEKIKNGEELKDYDLDFLEQQKIAADEAERKKALLSTQTHLSKEMLARLAQKYPSDPEADRKFLLELGIDPDNIPKPVTIDEYVKGMYGGKD